MNSEFPELYSRNNALQRSWADSVCKWFASISSSIIPKTLTFNAVMDFGCGTGEITAGLADRISQFKGFQREKRLGCTAHVDSNSYSCRKSQAD